MGELPTRRYTIAGHCDLTADQARDEAIKLRGQIRMGVDPQGEKKARPASRTFAETADGYLRHVAKTLRPSSAKEWGRIIEHDVKPAWGAGAIDAITRRDVRDLIEGVSGRGAEVQANRTLARLKTLFNWAIQQDIIAASPAAGLKPVAKEVERDRVLSDEEIRGSGPPATGSAGRTARCSSFFCLRPSGATRSAAWNGAI